MLRHTSRAHVLVLALAATALCLPARAEAGCGCAKPPPPRALVRPFVGHVDQKVVLFSDSFVDGTRYAVRFTSSSDGSVDWSKGKASMRRDFADGVAREQLRVSVPSVSLGPCEIDVFAGDGSQVLTVTDDQFTVTSLPIALHDFNENVVRNGYQAGVGKDGTVYIAVDVSEVSGGTVFTGTGNGFPLTFGASNVAMYNEQGFLMQLLDPTSPGLFRITLPLTLSLLQAPSSYTLSYWRHEFRTYKQDHRLTDAHRTDDDPDWHADGSPHIDHNHIVVAIAGVLTNGSSPQPGATPPFQLQIQSSAADNSPLQ
jgi:hypothetical protein